MDVWTKLLYKTGLLMAWGARALWSDKPPATNTPKNASPYVFLITSTINTSPRHLGANTSLVRSVYSPDQRFNQTLKTIESIRQRVPDARVLLLENSKLLAYQQSVLESVCDQLILLSEDNVAVGLRDGPNKGAAEAYLLMNAQLLLKDCDFKILFKLSGRYVLSERFDRDRFPLDRFGFLKRDGVVSTRLYSVPVNLRNHYERQLSASFLATRFGVSIEDVISRGLKANQIKFLDPIGVSGPLAVDSGVFIDE